MNSGAGFFMKYDFFVVCGAAGRFLTFSPAFPWERVCSCSSGFWDWHALAGTCARCTGQAKGRARAQGAL